MQYPERRDLSNSFFLFNFANSGDHGSKKRIESHGQINREKAKAHHPNETTLQTIKEAKQTSPHRPSNPSNLPQAAGNIRKRETPDPLKLSGAKGETCNKRGETGEQESK